MCEGDLGIGIIFGILLILRRTLKECLSEEVQASNHSFDIIKAMTAHAFSVFGQAHAYEMMMLNIYTSHIQCFEFKLSK